MSAQLVERLDLTAVPEGSIRRLLVLLHRDALDRPVRVPVMVAAGTSPGPVVGVTAALHGNEINGVPVIHRLFEKLDLQKLRGTVVAVPVVNVPGFLAGTRNFRDDRDLNHLMPGKAEGHAAEVYAHRFMERIVRQLEVLVDLHTASFGRANSLYVRADMLNPTTARMAYLQRPQIIVHNPPHDGTLRGAADDLGIPAITVEIGNPHRFQPEYIRRSLVGIRRLLADLKMVPRRAVAPGPEPLLCASSHWLFTRRGGLLRVLPQVTEHVEAGQVLATLTDPFGDVIDEIVAPHAGVVIGRAIDPVVGTGGRVVHLGQVADDDHGFLRRGPE